MDAKAAAEARRQRILNAGARRMAVVKGEADTITDVKSEQSREGDSGMTSSAADAASAFVPPVSSKAAVPVESNEASSTSTSAAIIGSLSSDNTSADQDKPDTATTASVPEGSSEDTNNGTNAATATASSSGGGAKRVLARRREKVAQAAATLAASAPPAASLPEDQQLSSSNSTSTTTSSTSEAKKATTPEDEFLNAAFHEAVSTIDVVEPDSVKKINETIVNKSTDRAAAVVFADPPVPSLPKVKARPRMLGASDFKRICQILVIIALSITNGYFSHRRLGTNVYSNAFDSYGTSSSDLTASVPTDETLQELQRFLSVDAVPARSGSLHKAASSSGGGGVGSVEDEFLTGDAAAAAASASAAMFGFSTGEVPLQTRILQFVHRWAVFVRENVFFAVILTMWCFAPMIAEPIMKPILLLCGVFVCDDASGGAGAGGLIGRVLSIAMGGIGGALSVVFDYVGLFALHIVLSLLSGAAFALWTAS